MIILTCKDLPSRGHGLEQGLPVAGCWLLVARHAIRLHGASAPGLIAERGENLEVCLGEHRMNTCLGQHRMNTCLGQHRMNTCLGEHRMNTCLGEHRMNTCLGEHRMNTCLGEHPSSRDWQQQQR